MERNIAIIWGLVRAMMDSAGLTKNMRGKLWCEAFKTSVNILNISAGAKDDKLRCEKWNNIIPAYSKHLNQFGEIGIVKKGGIEPKLDNKGVDCMFVGYAEDHSGDVARMLNLSTQRIMVSRDIKWLNHTYEEHLQRIKDKQDEASDSTDSIKIFEEKHGNIQTKSQSTRPELSEAEVVETVDSSSDESDNTKTSINPRRLQRKLKQLGVDVDLPQTMTETYNLRTTIRNMQPEQTNNVKETYEEFIEMTYHMPETCLVCHGEIQMEDDETVLHANLSKDKFFYSPLESDYKEPKNFRAMMKLPYEEGKK